MLRPLLLTETYPPARGGMAQSCDRIVRLLRRGGLQVDVAHLCRRADRVRIEQQQNGRLLTCPITGDPSHALNLLWNALAPINPPPTHLIAFGGTLPLLAGPALAAWLQTPLIVLLRGNDFDTGIFSPRHGWLLRDALARADHVGVVCRDHQRRVAALYPQTPVHWLPNSIEPEQWQLHAFDRDGAAAWRRDTVAPGCRVLGLFGQLKRKKGGLLLLDALQRSGRAERFHLLVVGEIEPEMQASLAAADTLGGLTCLPFLDRFALLPWYAACDLIAVPSHYDGMPNVVLEAAALGIPVLASTAGGLADLLLDGADALTFAPGDLQQCRLALLRAADADASALSALGQRLQQRVLDEFTPERETERYLDLLRLSQRTAAEPTPPIHTACATLRSS